MANRTICGNIKVIFRVRRFVLSLGLIIVVSLVGNGQTQFYPLTIYQSPFLVGTTNWQVSLFDYNSMGHIRYSVGDSGVSSWHWGVGFGALDIGYSHNLMKLKNIQILSRTTIGINSNTVAISPFVDQRLYSGFSLTERLYAYHVFSLGYFASEKQELGLSLFYLLNDIVFSYKISTDIVVDFGYGFGRYQSVNAEINNGRVNYAYQYSVALTIKLKEK